MKPGGELSTGGKKTKQKNGREKIRKEKKKEKGGSGGQTVTN